MPRGGHRPGAGRKPSPPHQKKRTTQVRVGESLLQTLAYRVNPADPKTKRAAVEAGLLALARLAPGRPLVWRPELHGLYAGITWLGASQGVGARVVAYIAPKQHGFAVMSPTGENIVLHAWPNDEPVEAIQRKLEALALRWWE